MRERLQRAKSIDNFEWYQGHYHEQVISLEESIHWLINNKLMNVRGIFKTNYIKIEPNTLGDYSGLPDITGKRIFEGDIVEYNPYFHNKEVDICQVIFHSGAFVAKDVYIGSRISELNNPRVIGNIYDNPELMEVLHGKKSYKRV